MGKLYGETAIGTVAKYVIYRHSESEGRRISTLNRFFASLRMTKNGISQQSPLKKLFLREEDFFDAYIVGGNGNNG